jgi:hypothetical protein
VPALRETEREQVLPGKGEEALSRSVKKIKKPIPAGMGLVFNGANDGIRTRDIQNHNLTL